MAKTVTFGMVWQEYGIQTVFLPDEVNEKDEGEVIRYINSIWASIPLPEGDYVSGSDMIDTEGCFVINHKEP